MFACYICVEEKVSRFYCILTQKVYSVGHRAPDFPDCDGRPYCSKSMELLC